jgi:hypothetical protein
MVFFCAKPTGTDVNVLVNANVNAPVPLSGTWYAHEHVHVESRNAELPSDNRINLRHHLRSKLGEH